MTPKQYEPIVDQITESVCEDRRFRLLCEETMLTPRALMIEFFKVYEPSIQDGHEKQLVTDFFAWVDFNLSGENEVAEFHELSDCFDESNFDETDNTYDE